MESAAVLTNGGFVAESSSGSKWRRALRFSFPYRKSAVVIFCFTLLMVVGNGVEPLIMKFVFDGLTGPRIAVVLLTGIGWLLALEIAREVGSGISNYLTWRTRLGLHYALLEVTVDRLHRLPLSFHRAEGVGAIMTKLDRGIQGFIGAASQVLFEILPQRALPVAHKRPTAGANVWRLTKSNMAWRETSPFS